MGKILLHGAVNGSNFGDCLFADIFYHKILESVPNVEVYFKDDSRFGISEYLRNELEYKKKCALKDMDVLVYISGGYFGEDKKSFLQAVIRYFRYLFMANHFIRNKKDIYVVGLEVGPLHYNFLKKKIRQIISCSRLTIVRNSESYDYCLNELGVSNVICSTDSALCISLDEIKEKGKFDRTVDEKYKMIFLHLQANDQIDEEFCDKILTPLVKFIQKNPEYYVVYGADGLEKQNINVGKISKMFEENEIQSMHYVYTNHWNLCALLSKASVIITRRLHVGIIGCLCDKVVFSFPIHTYKTERFYKQINYLDHCVLYSLLTAENFTNLMENKIHEKAIINSSFVVSAKKNISTLISMLNEV